MLKNCNPVIENSEYTVAGRVFASGDTFKSDPNARTNVFEDIRTEWSRLPSARQNLLKGAAAIAMGTAVINSGIGESVTVEVEVPRAATVWDASVKTRDNLEATGNVSVEDMRQLQGPISGAQPGDTLRYTERTGPVHDVLDAFRLSMDGVEVVSKPDNQ